MLHVYAQEYEGASAYIVGSREDLQNLAIKIIEAVNYEKSKETYCDKNEKRFYVRVVRIDHQDTWKKLKSPQASYNSYENASLPIYPHDLYNK